MDTANQFTVFCLCFLYGTACALLYDLIVWECGGGTKLYKRFGVYVKSAVQIALFIAFAFGFTALSTLFYFPSVRLYMYGGILFGVFLYLKSWHRTVDFFKNVCYNVIIKKVYDPFYAFFLKRKIKAKEKRTRKKIERNKKKLSAKAKEVKKK